MSVRWTVALLCAAALARGVLVALVIPPFHGVDEQAHFDYVERLAEARALPEVRLDCAALSPEVRAAVQQLVEPVNFRPELPLPGLESLQLPDPRAPASRRTSGCGQAASYPPLYYLLAALPVSLAPAAPLLHRLFLARLASALLGAATVLFSLLAARRLLGDPAAALAVALLVLLQPQLAFLFGVVNNDAALFACTAAALAGIAELNRDPRSRRGLIELGVAGVCAALGKPTFLVLAPALGVLAFAAAGLRWRAPLALLPGVIAGAAFAAVRGDALPAGAPHALAFGTWLRDYALSPRRLHFVWHELYWMGWGWADTWLSKLWYALLLGLLGSALVGAALAWRTLTGAERGLLRAGALATALALAALYAIEISFLRRTGQPLLQGRYLLPLFPLHAAMLVCAWRGAARAARTRLDPSWGGVAFLFLMLCASVVRALARYHA